jgi:hypothetical protein
MSDEYIKFGDLSSELTEDALTIPLARDTFKACVNHKFFELVELRCFIQEGKRIAEMLVVDCTNDGVPTQNEIGILYRERLGLIFHTARTQMPEVRALRQNFPPTIHQWHK